MKSRGSSEPNFDGAVTEMEQKLRLLCVFMLLVQVSLAKVHRITAVKGQTVHLKCPSSGAKRTSMDWKNPGGDTLFFKDSSGKVLRGLRSQRFNIVKQSASEFTVSISRVTLKDGGDYLCNQYDKEPTQKIVKLTVLGPPKMETTRKRGLFFITCTAEASHDPPQIMWTLDQQSDIPATTHLMQRNEKYVSRSTLTLPSKRKRFTVGCLVRHPDLKEHLLMDFITLKPSLNRPPSTSGAATTQLSTASPQTTSTGWIEEGGTTTGVTGSTLDLTTASPQEHSREYNPTASENNTVLEGFTGHNDTTGGTSFNETAEEALPDNNTGRPNDLDMQKGSGKSSALLIVLVTFLILCLVVVVIFIAIKLRKAHVAWKKENEESNPSMESSKSKSSQEESSSQAQRRRGILNTAFAPYAVEHQMATSVINTAVMTEPSSPIRETPSLPQTTEHIATICYPKETEL